MQQSLFDIYIYENKLTKAEETMNHLEQYLRNIAKYSKDDINEIIYLMKEILTESKERLEL